MPRFKSLFTNYQGVIFGFLLLSFGFDFIDKIEIFYDIEFIKLNRVLKAIFLIYSVVFIGRHLKYVYTNLKIVLAIIVLLTIVFLLKNNFSELYINEYLRYIFPLVVFPLLYFTYKDKKTDLLVKLFKFFKWSVIINTVLILMGILFDLKIFKTYEFTRFGFNGFLLSQGFTPYFYLCATTIFWVFNKNKLLLLVILLSILTGVKGVYFAEFLLLCLLTLSNKYLNKNFKVKVLFFSFMIFIGLITGLFLMPTFKEVIKTDGLISAIFSHRLNYSIELFKEITPNNYNIFIGATNLNKVRLELQIIDIILFFGILGLTVYTYIIYISYKYLAKATTAKVFFISSITLSTLSGNLFYVPLSSFLIYVMLFALNQNKIRLEAI